MKYFATAFILLSSGNFQRTYAQTNVSGDLTSDTTWNVAGSPYIVQADVNVDSGVILTINPGVTVKFYQNTSIGVDGTIRAVGDVSNPVTFEADNSDSTDISWAGIYLTDTSTPFAYLTQTGSFFHYCYFFSSRQPNLHVDTSGNTTFTVHSKVSLGFDHCLVQDCACGLSGSSGSQVSANIFKECTSDDHSGYLVKLGQNSVIYNNLFYKNAVSNSTGILKVNKNIKVYNNVFACNTFDSCAAMIFEDSSQFYGNTFVDDTSKNDSIFMQIAGGVIYQNTFTRNKGALQTFILSDCNPDFYKNNILRNESTVQDVGVEMTTSSGTGPNAIEENNFWGFTNIDSIGNTIRDFLDDSALCKVDFLPFHFLPDTNAPLIPPVNVFKSNLLGFGIHVSWHKNSETDLRGYKVYFSGYTGYSFDNFVNVGSDTSINLPNLTVSDPIGVTAYDSSAYGSMAQYLGHESWFTMAVSLDSTSGIHDPTTVTKEIGVYPNPSDGNFLIRWLPASSSISLRIFDAQGKKVLDNNLSTSPVSLHLQKAGVYILEVIPASHIPGHQKIIVVQ